MAAGEHSVGAGYVLVVTSSQKKVVDFFDTTTGERLGRIEDVIAEPHEIAADQGRRLCYLTSTYRRGFYADDAPKSHEITVIDVDSCSVVDVIDTAPYLAPHDVEYDGVNDLLYASIEPNETGENGIVVIDPGDRKVVGHVPTPGRNSHWMALAPDGAMAYVAHKEDELISVVDLRTRTVVHTIPFAGGAEEIDVSADGASLFVVAPTVFGKTPPAEVVSSRLVRVDTSTFEVVGEVPLPPVNHAVRAVPDGRVLVSQMRPPAGLDVPGQLWVIDPAHDRLVSSVELDRMPFTIRVTPDSAAAFVSNSGAGTVSVVDLTSLQVVRTFESTPDPMLGGTHGLCLLPAG